MEVEVSFSRKVPVRDVLSLSGTTRAHARADMPSSTRERARSTGFARPSIGSFPSILSRQIQSRGVCSQVPRRAWKAGMCRSTWTRVICE
jgi:hypothetical protein